MHRHGGLREGNLLKRLRMEGTNSASWVQTDLARYGYIRTCMFPGEVVVIMSSRREVRPEASQPTGAFRGACLMLHSERRRFAVVCPSYGAQARGCGRHFRGMAQAGWGLVTAFGDGMGGCVFGGFSLFISGVSRFSLVSNVPASLGVGVWNTAG